MLFLCCQTMIWGQITISNNYFLNAGDSLVTATATSQTVRNVRISNATATAQNWDYSFLRARTPTARTVERYRVLNPTVDTAILREFPTATTVIADSVGQIAVYRRSATRFDLLGYFNAYLRILPTGLRPKFEPVSLERRAPLLFSSTNNNKTGFGIPFSIAFLPDTILAFLPVRPDSLRLRFVTNRQDRVDAFGKIRIPGSGNLDCLRERRYEITETRMDAKTTLLPFWVDITTFLPTTLFQQRDTSLVFNFWSNDFKEPLLSIRADNDSTPISAEYKWLPINTPTVETNTTVTAVLFPNPTKNALFVDLEGLNLENHVAHVVDYTGRVVWTQQIKNGTDKAQLRIDTHLWASGMYFLGVYTYGTSRYNREGGNTLLQRSFVVSR